MATTEELVKKGVDLFGGAEVGTLDAINDLLDIRQLYSQAYANGDLDGAAAIDAECEATSIIGALGDVRKRILALHLRSTEFAKAAGKDIEEPYAELPPRMTRSGGR